MPIQSTPVTTQSTINLSDINIDTDLDMGANSIVGYTPLSSLNSYFKYFTYDKSIISITPFTLWSKATEYSQNDVNWVTKWSETLNSTLNENLVAGFKYVLKDSFEIKTNGPSGSAAGFGGYSFDNAKTFAYAHQSTDYATVTMTHTPIAYNTTVNFQVKGNHPAYYGYVRNHTTTVIGKTPTTPITSTNFNIDKIIGIILPTTGDKVKINNDTTLTYTQTKPVYLFENLLVDTYDDRQVEIDSTHYYCVDKNSKILDMTLPITQIDIITGNPIFIYTD